MKGKSCPILVLISAMTYCSISACGNKQLLLPIRNYGNRQVQKHDTPSIFILVARDWQPEQNNIFTDSFNNLFQSSPDDKKTVRVYLMVNSSEIQINQFINYMQGQLWATTTSSDVKIHYRNFVQPKLPFDYLN